jgi:hypothetical protein
MSEPHTTEQNEDEKHNEKQANDTKANWAIVATTIPIVATTETTKEQHDEYNDKQ